MERETEEGNKRGILLTALCTENDQEIWDLINRDHDLMNISIEYACATWRTEACERCAGSIAYKKRMYGRNFSSRELIKKCSCRSRWMPCICCYDLEQAPLSVSDRAILHRISINSHIGACPHAYYLWTNDKFPSCMETFCQDRMEDWYSVVDLMSRADTVKHLPSFDVVHSSIDTQTCGAYMEHFLLRLGKLQILDDYMKRNTRQNFLFGSQRTLFETFTIWHLAVLLNQPDFIFTSMKHKNVLKVMHRSETKITYEMCKLRTVLGIVIEKDRADIFKMMLKIWKKKLKRNWIIDARFQNMLRACLDKSFRLNKFEFAHAILQNNMIHLNHGDYMKNYHAPPIHEGVQEVIKMNRVNMWNLLTSCPGFKKYYVPAIAPLTVFCGNTEMCNEWLQNYRKYYLEAVAVDGSEEYLYRGFVNCTSDVKRVDLYTIAVLRNFPEILVKLVLAELPEVKTGQLSALDYAKCFKRKRCCEILSCANFSSKEDLTAISPLVEVQRLDTTVTFQFSILDLISELLQNGYNVNFEDANGITAVQMAVKRMDYKSVRLLLLNGADLFQGQSFIVEKGTFSLLIEVFYCNVDTFGHLQRLKEVAYSYPYDPSSLRRTQIASNKGCQFIAECVHSLSSSDKSVLSRHVSYDVWLQNKSLQDLCRMSLRRHYGRLIHQFVSGIIMPESLKNFILLRDVIEKFLSFFGWNYDI